MNERTASNGDTSSSLLTRARNQDGPAWLQLASWIGPFILCWCRRGGLQSSDRDEVSQEVLLRIWRGLGNFRKDRPGDSFRAWVYTITRNCIHDLIARLHSGHQPLPAGLPPRNDPSEAADLKQHALHLLVQELVASHVGDRGFLAFYRTAVDGLSASEAAHELNTSADNVRQQKSRWIKRLREQLADRFSDLLD